MRIVVAGGTGVVGRHTMEAVQQAGHEAVALSRATGVDLINGRGLDAALEGAHAVIDASNISTLKAGEAIEFFTAATGNLLSAAAGAGVAHVVVLSIVGIDRMPYDYYAGKVAQEKIVEVSTVPWTIQRATQFHEFAEQVFESARIGALHLAPRARTQPIAAQAVGERLAALAVGTAQGRARDLAGPREEALEDMIIAFARSRGYRGWIPRVSLPTAQMKGMRAGLALPGPDADRATQTFADWIAQR